MNPLIAIAFIGGLSLILALILAIANSKLKVFEDPRIGKVEEMLPGANCGACGQPGCRAFAEDVIEGNSQPSACTVGGPDTATGVAKYLGIDPGSSIRKVARLLCAGGTDVAVKSADYAGFESCRGAAAVSGGPKACTYGCIGLADCEVVCDFDAIQMSPTGLPFVNASKCTACGDCVDVCPKNLFELIPINQHLLVQCKSALEGDEILEMCEVACTACTRCAADAPEGLIEMKNNLPVINPEKIKLETDIATLRCPTGAITWVEEQQFSAKEEKIV
ncbi:MAG: RnfABCDGE type electron transport complex subunit B [Calditrichaeota bacterium]|nr:MAG: RnfABCDGE type electron transport complex subunit B [Calditrichota bacterium]MBL1207688.1 RnfABCDGE type electron transport complex subunit B [Calditrichota bacterium]NOG47522.1 RnfABCDGE type electron transport complex subunit B [Calditrichota bacterium]